MVDLALQLLMVGLLVLTIVWCVIVHQRLRRLRADRGEMQEFIAALSEATSRAEAAIQAMRAAGQAADQLTRDQQRRTRERGEELARLIESAGRVMRRLDTLVEGGTILTASARTRERTDPTRRHSAAVDSTPDMETRVRRTTMGEVTHPAKPVTPAQRRQAGLDELLHSDLREALQGLR